MKFTVRSKSLRDSLKKEYFSKRHSKNVSCIELIICIYMGVSENNGTPKSSILIGISIINHPFWGTTILGNIHIYT